MAEPPIPPEQPWASPGYQPPASPPDPPHPSGSPSSPLMPPPGPGASHPQPVTPGTYTFPALEPEPLEPLAVASVFTSPLSPVGLGLGIAATRRIARNHRRGKGLAVVGIILSSLFLAASLLVLATFALDGTFARQTEKPVAGDVPATRALSPVNLDVGNCVLTLPVTASVGEVTATPCAEEHQLQVIDRVPLGGEGYPGQESLFQGAEESCQEAFDALTPDVDSWPDTFRPHHLVPSEENWADGERNVICFARSSAGPVTVDLLDG